MNYNDFTCMVHHSQSDEELSVCILHLSLIMYCLSILQEITPQLFARLSSHPEHVVRKQLEALLMMLAKSSPWSIVYPTLVDVNACEGKPSEELQHIMGCLVCVYFLSLNFFRYVYHFKYVGNLL